MEGRGKTEGIGSAQVASNICGIAAVNSTVAGESEEVTSALVVSGICGVAIVPSVAGDPEEAADPNRMESVVTGLHEPSGANVEVRVAPRTNICKRSCGTSCSCSATAEVLWRGDKLPVTTVEVEDLFGSDGDSWYGTSDTITTATRSEDV